MALYTGGEGVVRLCLEGWVSVGGWGYGLGRSGYAAGEGLTRRSLARRGIHTHPPTHPPTHTHIYIYIYICIYIYINIYI